MRPDTCAPSARIESVRALAGRRTPRKHRSGSACTHRLPASGQGVPGERTGVTPGPLGRVRLPCVREAACPRQTLKRSACRTGLTRDASSRATRLLGNAADDRGGALVDAGTILVVLVEHDGQERLARRRGNDHQHDRAHGRRGQRSPEPGPGRARRRRAGGLSKAQRVSTSCAKRRARHRAGTAPPPPPGSTAAGLEQEPIACARRHRGRASGLRRGPPADRPRQDGGRTSPGGRRRYGGSAHRPRVACARTRAPRRRASRRYALCPPPYSG